MGYLYFLLGGARSGKSSYAEELARNLSDKVAYIATAEITDEEMQKRIDLHKSRRISTWKTFELENGTPDMEDFKKILNSVMLEKYEVVLLDCITILLFRLIHNYRLDEMEIIDNELEKKIGMEVEAFFRNLLEIIKVNDLKFIVVSNEVGMGVVPPYPLGRIFRDFMGIVNKQMASASDEVYFFVAGLKQRLK
ncbi:MAG: bifunctional adenosylcobinamide kinase/adenosylcobinamide-phosphate guanylyltransferase [Actinobacteria bacterium]|nr:bifunctional adenosylcobinamide kinase/adenosylcobinamide-phosphate guanylyltransferase [Cyanobacteriota bacterium]MCL5772560.1 bifunctional adenosylcobinamide kinase/adenosylcobinamide-phosphate guanylyltransferase [Actinomycetota bacterium]